MTNAKYEGFVPWTYNDVCSSLVYDSPSTDEHPSEKCYSFFLAMSLKKELSDINKCYIRDSADYNEQKKELIKTATSIVDTSIPVIRRIAIEPTQGDFVKLSFDTPIDEMATISGKVIHDNEFTMLRHAGVVLVGPKTMILGGHSVSVLWIRLDGKLIPIIYDINQPQCLFKLDEYIYTHKPDAIEYVYGAIFENFGKYIQVRFLNEAMPKTFINEQSLSDSTAFTFDYRADTAFIQRLFREARTATLSHISSQTNFNQVFQSIVTQRQGGGSINSPRSYIWLIILIGIIIIIVICIILRNRDEPSNHVDKNTSDAYL
jgi:hypothetical protein